MARVRVAAGGVRRAIGSAVASRSKRGRRELALFGAMYVFYDAARWLFAGQQPAARAHADWIIHVERSLHLAIERSVQRALGGDGQLAARQRGPEQPRTSRSRGLEPSAWLDADRPVRAIRRLRGRSSPYIRRGSTPLSDGVDA